MLSKLLLHQLQSNGPGHGMGLSCLAVDSPA